MPVFRLTPPGQPAELVEADSARHEGRHVVLYGQALAIGQPREVVVRRVPDTVVVEQVPDDTAGATKLSWLM